MIATIGGVNTVWVTAATFVCSIAAMAVLQLPGAHKPNPDSRPDNVISGVVEGLKFVWHNQVLRTLGLIDLAVTGLYLPMESPVPEILHRPQRTSRTGLGTHGVVHRWTGRSAGLVGAVTAFHQARDGADGGPDVPGAASVVIARLPPLPVILVLAALIGLVYGPIGPIYNSVMQTRTPENLRGRVVGVMTSMAYTAGPVGFMLAGPLVDSFGLRAAFLGLAIPILAIALLCPWIPALRDLDHEPTTPSWDGVHG